MRINKLLLSSLLIVLLIGITIMVTACSKSETDNADGSDNYSENLLLTIELSSDSENGNEWSFEQDKDLFHCEEFFMEDEGNEEGGEIQAFTLYPKASGSTTLKFTNESTSTTYTYECTVNDKLDDVTIDTSNGESNGESVDAPELILERN